MHRGLCGIAALQLGENPNLNPFEMLEKFCFALVHVY